MIRLPVFDPKRTFDSWKQISLHRYSGGRENIMEPLSMAVITRMISEYGEEAVAGIWRGRTVRSAVTHWIVGAVNGDDPLCRSELRRGQCRSDSCSATVWREILATMGRRCIRGPLPLCRHHRPHFNDDGSVIAAVILFLQIIPIIRDVGISILVNSMFNALESHYMPPWSSYYISLFSYCRWHIWDQKYMGLKGIFIGIAVGMQQSGLSPI